jgi:EAL domain-containing protein (putative c-di-GMP-specific phosphodiesterase class I)/CHASE2 domain-containing sensor protein
MHKIMAVGQRQKWTARATVNQHAVIELITFARAREATLVEGSEAQVSKRAKTIEKKPWKLLLWTVLAGLVFGLIGFGELPEDYLRVARNSFHEHKASGEIVVIAVDEPSLRQVGNWPWPRHLDGQMVDRLMAGGAKRIYFDINFSYPSNPVDDEAFARSIERSGHVSLFVRSTRGPNGSIEPVFDRPLPILSKHAKLALGSVRYNYQNAAWRLPYSAMVDGKRVPSFAASLANVDRPAGTSFPVDYSARAATIPTYSAADLLSGRIPRSALAGKDVVIGLGSDILNDVFFIPNYGRGYGMYVQVLGAETLKRGKPLDLGWLPAFLFATVLSAFVVSRSRAIERGAFLTVGVAALAVGPIFLESRLIFTDVTPALFVILTMSAGLGWKRYRARGFVNPISNLPNLNALRANKDGRNQALVAARLMNYEEIIATLPRNSERQLIEQIVARLKVGSPSRVLYQGDAGIFAWFEDPRQPFGNHLEALYALFRNPARIDGLSVDLTIAFGVEVGSGRSIDNRLASALVAADEAAHDGLKWKYHDPESLENASWKLSMLSQLDEAIDRDEVWVAYQPKLDLATKRIVGAEALARWTHPEKGPIAASEFVAAAEQNNRIGKLTDFVLEKAIAAAAQINKRGTDFNMAVNLSARLLTDRGFTLRLAAQLARHGLPAGQLTLELTETAALTGSGEGLEMISRLRDLGVNIAIDDYGTGLSTLDYLKKIPANEIKIDQSFVKGMVDNRSDRLMVQSTIGLAHSLGRRVVAEGVEHRDILDLLVGMGCDIAQGFAVGRPMSLDSLTKRLTSDRKRTAA